MKTFKVLSLLLSYPETEWLEALPQLEQTLADEADPNGGAIEVLAPLMAHLRNESLIGLQEEYVATFDRNPSHSLHLFEHVHGESRDRGSAMVNLLEEYWKHGFEPTASELPDYLPLFLEFLSLLPEAQAHSLLGEAVHVIVHLGRKLSRNGSPYAAVFSVLESMSPVTAQALMESPARDMDEAMETFGPGSDGIEPLLKPGQQVSVVAMPRSRRHGSVNLASS